jgi:16S rRNA (guanine527-N7)-methyltransferase
MVTSRAFTELGGFLSLTDHLCGDNGVWLPMLGRQPQADSVPTGFELTALHRVTQPGQIAERHVARLVRRNMAQSG